MSDKLIIDVIGFIKMSIQSFTKLADIRSMSDDLHGASRTRRRTSSAVTRVRLSKPFLLSGGFNTHVRGEGRANDNDCIMKKEAECVR